MQRVRQPLTASFTATCRVSSASSGARPQNWFRDVHASNLCFVRQWGRYVRSSRILDLRFLINSYAFNTRVKQ